MLKSNYYLSLMRYPKQFHFTTHYTMRGYINRVYRIAIRY